MVCVNRPFVEAGIVSCSPLLIEFVDLGCTLLLTINIGGASKISASVNFYLRRCPNLPSLLMVFKSKFRYYKNDFQEQDHVCYRGGSIVSCESFCL
jgi:hypothetical protein